MNKFIHIGMPKTLTSALQQEFYPKHDSIYYLGIGAGGAIDYLDAHTEFIFETLLLYAKSGYYETQKHEAKKTLEALVKKAEAEGKQVFGMSSEWLSFNFLPDMIDNAMKVERLADLFGTDTKIIMFIRNQADLLKSLFNEYVKVGLPFTYDEFVRYTHNYKDRNFYFDLLYHHQYELYARHFSQSNIHFLPVENFRGKDKKLLVEDGKVKIVDALCRILEIDYPENFSLPHINPSLTDSELKHKISLNEKYRHEFGNLMFEHASKHRSRKYFERENAVNIPDYYDDIKVKRFAIEQAKIMAQTDPAPVSYDADTDVMKRLSHAFNASNKTLKSYGTGLPDIYTQMEL